MSRDPVVPPAPEGPAAAVAPAPAAPPAAPNRSWVDYGALGTSYHVDPSATCEVCGASAETFKDYNGRPKALCGKCNSAERQRVLAQIYGRFLRYEHPLEGRRILSVAPMHAERVFLRSLAPSEFLVVDARPEFKPDRVVDICAMPEIADGHFDALVASGVLSCVHDFDGALREIRRVLAEGGVFLHCEVNYGFNQRTVETASHDEITGWYGADALERHKVGLFRKLGDLDLIAALQEGFVVKTYYGRDSANGMTVVWHAAVKRSDVLAPRGRFVASNAVASPVSAEAVAAPAVASPPGRGEAGPNEAGPHEAWAREYATRLPDGFPARRIRTRLSVPAVAKELTYTAFAEHVVDRRTGEATREVIVTGKGVIGCSGDLGETFEVVRPAGLAHLEFDQCWTTGEGNRLIQTVGWRDARETRRDPAEWGRLLLFDRDWRVIADNALGASPWHGSWSIDERPGRDGAGTLMLAEYPNNQPLFRAEERATALAGGAGSEWLRPSRVWRSRDGGRSWQVVMELPPGPVRHFHTLLADPHVDGHWYLSSGDLPAESRIWLSRDDGDTWQEVSDPAPDVPVGPGLEAHAGACHRLTAMAIGEDRLLWVGDDVMAPYWETTFEDVASGRAGAWVFTSPKSTPLRPRAVARLGNAGRSLTDIGPAWIVTTEAKRGYQNLDPRVFLVAKSDPRLTTDLFSIETTAEGGSGLTFSRASRKAHGGTFFSYRLPTDGAHARPALMRWQVALE